MEIEILIRFLLAALWGGIVGMERQYHGKSAGFRTMIMISMGACFFTIMSKEIGSPGNADRIASNIVTGIGFLGAGVIFRGGENRVSGITTAATIWAVAAIGMGIGAGYYFAAAAASILIIFVLAILPYAEDKIDAVSLTRIYSIKRSFTSNAAEVYETLMRQQGLKYKRTAQVKENEAICITWEVRGHANKHNEFSRVVASDETVERFEF
jgi:putative Mg2+ transporter-C (MgtC) family protein